MSGWTYRTAVGFELVTADRLCYAYNKANRLLATAGMLRPDTECEVATSPSGRVWYSVAEADNLDQVIGWVTADPFFNVRFDLVLPDTSFNDNDK